MRTRKAMIAYPKISIITPSFNQVQYIEQTILSVINQNYPQLEYIIIDGGSTDGSVEIIKKYSDSLTYWTSETDKGQSDAINKGLKYATGDIINWVNSDDYLAEGVLLKIAKIFSNDDIHLLCGYTHLIFDDIIIKKRTSDVSIGFDKMIGTGHIMQPSTFFKKKIFDEFTPIAVDLHYMMDHYIWLQYICKYGVSKIKYINDTLAFMRLHENAKSIRRIKSFRDERIYLYNSLLKTQNVKTVYSPLSVKKTLTFPISKDIHTNAKNINYYFLISVLFYRNSNGRPYKIDISTLLLLIVIFPFSFFRYIIAHVIRKN